MLVGVTEQGQGTEASIAQIAADAVGVDIDKVRVVTGDTDVTPYGGGTWASRGAGIGGEAVLLAGQALSDNILDVAAAILKRERDACDVRRGRIVDRAHRAQQLLPCRARPHRLLPPGHAAGGLSRPS